MNSGSKRAAIFLLASLLLISMVAGAYAVSKAPSTKNNAIDKPQNNPNQSVGKNWETKESSIIQGGKLKPIIDFKPDSESSTEDKPAKQPRYSTNKNLEPVNEE